jgi:hypothetical protein
MRPVRRPSVDMGCSFDTRPVGRHGLLLRHAARPSTWAASVGINLLYAAVTLGRAKCANPGGRSLLHAAQATGRAAAQATRCAAAAAARPFRACRHWPLDRQRRSVQPMEPHSSTQSQALAQDERHKPGHDPGPAREAHRTRLGDSKGQGPRTAGTDAHCPSGRLLWRDIEPNGHVPSACRISPGDTRFAGTGACRSR